MSKKHLPPSKVKYNNSHPILSVRVNQLLKEKLEEIKETSGKSMGDILREAVGLQMESCKGAYQTGFERAKATFGVSYKCSKCGEDILIQNANAKEAVAEYMREKGWAHSKCIVQHTQKATELSSAGDGSLARLIIKTAQEAAK